MSQKVEDELRPFSHEPSTLFIEANGYFELALFETNYWQMT